MSRDRYRTIVAAAATLLSSVVLTAVFDDLRWAPYVAVAVIAVAAGGMGARAFGMPVWAQPLITLIVLCGYLTVVFGKGAALGVIPTGTTVRSFETLIRNAVDDIADLASPAPTRLGLLLLATAGIGAVAILVDLLAVGLRRAAVSGVVLLTVYAVPVAVDRDGLSGLLFFPGVLGYLWLLIVDNSDRLRRWGRQIGAEPGTEPASSTTAPSHSSGFLLSSCAVVLALAVPSLLPGLSHAGIYNAGGGGGLGPGGSRSIETINPLTTLEGQLKARGNTELLRVRTNDNDPFYLRLTTLDVFDRTGWTQRPLKAGTENRVARKTLRDPGLAADTPRTEVRTTVEVRGLARSQYLPVYANSNKIEVKGDWRYEPVTQTVFTTRTNTGGLKYGFQSQHVDYQRDQLRAAPATSPDDPITLEFAKASPSLEAQRIVDGLIKGKTSPYDKVLAIDQYFSPANGFRYSLQTKAGTSGDQLIDFLTNKQGFCQQFASAMAYLVRLAGVPARVAVGFTRGTAKRGYWSIRNQDAHAWVEVYFTGLGWVPFDPTPLGAGGNAASLDYANPPVAEPGSPDATPGLGTAPTGPSGSSEPTAGLDRGGNQSSGAASSSSPVPWATLGWWGLGVVVVVLLLLVPAGLRKLLRRRRRRIAASGDPISAAHAGWQEILDTLTDLRNSPAGSETPRALAARLSYRGSFDVDTRQAIGLLASAEEYARYAASPGPVAGLSEAMTVTRSRLIARASRRERWRAALIPASVLWRGTSAVEGRMDGFSDAADRGRARLRRTLTFR
jgi:transglutaminase-like putative cysteine protease